MWPRTGPVAWTENPGEKIGLLGEVELQSEVGKVKGMESSIKYVHRNILVSRGEEVMWSLDFRREWPEGEGTVAKIMPHQSEPCRTQGT